MAYFIILPLWGIALVGMTGATMATRLVPRLAPAYPFAWRMLLWSSVTFVGSNVIVLAFYVLAARIAGSIGQSAHPAAQLGLGAALLLAPVVASGAGFVGGAGVGAWLAHRATRKRQFSAPA